MKQIIKCKYCRQTLMEVEKKDYENTNFYIGLDIIKKCEGCTKKRKEYVERQFSITDILKSTQNTIIV